MLTFTLKGEYASEEDLVQALEHIAGLIEQGNTSGYYPTWSMDGKRELPPHLHHEDCDYQNSHAAHETAKTFGLDEEHEVFECNLGCND